MQIPDRNCGICAKTLTSGISFYNNLRITQIWYLEVGCCSNKYLKKKMGTALESGKSEEATKIFEHDKERPSCLE